MLAQMLLSLSFLVAVHEFGHLLAAKYFGMRVEQFSVGFPPKLFSFKKGETEYALSAIPLGGYVKISGMIDESLDTEAMKLPPQPWEFRAKPAWQRLIVMMGGIIVNIISGILIFIILAFYYGDKYVPASEARHGIIANGLAQEIGLKTGDQIVKINGKPFTFSGFGWDYGGTIIDWHAGKLAPASDEAIFARVQLRMPQGNMGDEPYPQGDSRFSSDDPRWKDLGITVGGFSVNFPGVDDL